jgi:dihydrofolate reductase
MKISLIAAVSKNNVIGDGEKLLWHIPGDLPRFKEITTGHHILMGRKTFESIGRVLPNRKNLIISTNKKLKIKDAEVFGTPEKAVEYAAGRGETELMIIGGSSVYHFFLHQADRIYLTRVFKDYEGSAKFPEIDSSKWDATLIEKNEVNDPPFETVILDKKKI